MSEPSHDVLVVGELNVDLILNQIQGFPEVGKEILADEVTMTLGSSSAIFASNLSALGTSVSFFGMIGEDSFADTVIGSLQERKVDTNPIIQDPHLNTGITVALNYGNDRAMITHQGAMSKLSMEAFDPDLLTRVQHLHFSSYFLQPGLAKNLDVLMKQARKNGVTTSLDIQWDPGEQWDFDAEIILPHVDLFLPNETELKQITGKTDLETALQSISEFSNITAVKLGEKGSAYMQNGEIQYASPYPNEEVVDAIGAGDSFNAGFIHKYLSNADLAECARAGNLCGMLSTTAPGGTDAFENMERLKKIARSSYEVDLEQFLEI